MSGAGAFSPIIWGLVDTLIFAQISVAEYGDIVENIVEHQTDQHISSCQRKKGM